LVSVYVLDTDTLSLYYHGHPQVSRRVLAHAADRLTIAVITAEEILGGWLGQIHRATRPDMIERCYAELADWIPYVAVFTILPYRQSTIAQFQQLRRMKLNVGNNDLRIAAIALENNATVVTRNLRDFARVPGVAAEDWAA
jgi:tRNA(fMet)-specific endonuclease VapC